MGIDTGMAVSLMSVVTSEELWPGRSVGPATVQLCSYSGEKIPVAGKVEVTVSYKGQVAKAPMVVVQGTGPTLFSKIDFSQAYQQLPLHEMSQKPCGD